MGTIPIFGRNVMAVDGLESENVSNKIKSADILKWRRLQPVGFGPCRD
jgi:hypothetical protein